MGEVYRARDSRLQRPVAIKVLSDAMAQNEERRARFEQEAPNTEDDSFAISSSGTLVYLPRRPRHDHFVWHDRKGKALIRWEPGIENSSFSLSPDQTQLLISAPVKDQQHRAIFLFDSRTGKTTQVSLADSIDHHDDPIWSPDGRSFGFVVHRTPSVIKHHDFATGNEVNLYTVKRGVLFLEDWSADGKKLVFVQKDYINQPQVGQLSLDGGPPQFHEVAGNNFDEVSLSPDGAWLSYQTLVGHIWEIFLAPWGGTTSVKLTPEGGVQPRFSRAGESIYFLGLDGRLMTVALPQSGTATVALPNELFATGITTALVTTPPLSCIFRDT